VIVQASAAIGPRFVIRNGDHAGIVLQLARVFGNTQFDPLEPRPFIEYAIAHQAEGWRRFDLLGTLDPRDGRPDQEARSRASLLTECVRRTVDFNERHHPFCGVLSSRRATAMCEAQAALSATGDDERRLLHRAIAAERIRQRRLLTELRGGGWPAKWIHGLDQVCGVLDFLEQLARYLESVHPMLWQPARFPHVPASCKRRAALTLRPAIDATVVLRPYPFCTDPVALSCPGQYVRPARGRHEFSALLREAPVVRQTYVMTGVSPTPGDPSRTGSPASTGARSIAPATAAREETPSF
jgi:hypothetical protein